MNYLAHIYLSGENDQLKIGNFMADPIKGKAYEKYSGDIQKGILLHRAIDTFTDTHPIVRQSAGRLFEKFRHYNGVIVDVFYDHFLAKNWKTYHPQPLADYTEGFYQLLATNLAILPASVQRFFPYMKQQNWLLSYRDISGIEKALRNMSTRIRGGYQLDDSIVVLNKHYAEFEHEFKTFFPEIMAYVRKKKVTF